MKAAQERGLNPSTGVGVGLLASILLALLTISVFYVLQDYGPESAVRKYNQAVLSGDVATIDYVTGQTINTPDGQWLLAEVRYFLKSGGQPRLTHMDRSPEGDRCVATVEYVEPEPRSYQFLFVVKKVNHVWQISPSDSHRAFEYALHRS